MPRPSALPLAVLLALFVSLLSLPPLAADKLRHAEVRRTEGLHAVQFRLKEGAVEVLLPYDLGVGETVSGSLIVHTAGMPGKKRDKNRQKMGRLGVRIGGLSRPAASTAFGPVAVCAGVAGSKLPVLSCERSGDGSQPGASHRLSVQLLNPKGHVILEAVLPVAATLEAGSSGYSYLPLGKAGEPLEIVGPFDGDVTNTRVSLEGHGATPLAESPRRTVVRCPLSILGPTRLQLVERGNAVSGPFRSLAVMLRLSKPVLQTGERTIVEVVINGLDDLDADLPLELVSLTPEAAQLERGPRYPLTISPREVQSGGVYPWVGTVVGVSPAPIDLEVQLEGARPRQSLRPAGSP